jgi:2-amino-4-hydroxy-6-hydroxymethyldihydropteridine diphosphokinase
MAHNVYLAVGSNINPAENLRTCLKLLREKFTVIATSPVYETPPVGFTEQAPFLNAAIHIQTDDDPTAVKSTLLAIENELGRVRDSNNKNAPRTIDLDIALWDDATFTYGEKNWRVPDPDILRFIHIARPLADLAPDYIYPENSQPLSAIATNLDNSDITQRQDFEWAT